MNNIQLIEKILYYIDEHLDEKITFEYLAEKFNYSAFHFHRLFSAVTGQSVTDYLKKRRLMYAYKDLQETEKSITDICYTYGFNSIQTFNRLFKDTYSVKPSDLRKSHMENTFRSIDTILAGYKKRVQFKGDFIMEPMVLKIIQKIFTVSHCSSTIWRQLKSREIQMHFGKCMLRKFLSHYMQCFL